MNCCGCKTHFGVIVQDRSAFTLRPTWPPRSDLTVCKSPIDKLKLLRSSSLTQRPRKDKYDTSERRKTLKRGMFKLLQEFLFRVHPPSHLCRLEHPEETRKTLSSSPSSSLLFLPPPLSLSASARLAECFQTFSAEQTTNLPRVCLTWLTPAHTH